MPGTLRGGPFRDKGGPARDHWDMPIFRPSTNAADVAELLATQREHGRRLDDHDGVLTDIRDHLARVVDEFGKFQTKVLVAAALVFGGSDTGQDLIRQVLGI